MKMPKIRKFQKMQSRKSNLNYQPEYFRKSGTRKSGEY
jgi:hypothetical protein